jgi:hypothetical protein
LYLGGFIAALLVSLASNVMAAPFRNRLFPAFLAGLFVAYMNWVWFYWFCTQNRDFTMSFQYLAEFMDAATSDYRGQRLPAAAYYGNWAIEAGCFWAASIAGAFGKGLDAQKLLYGSDPTNSKKENDPL